MTTSTQQFESEGGNRNVPVPSVSLGLGNDLDPKFGRWIITGGIVGFWAVNFLRQFGMLRGDQPKSNVMGGPLGWFLIGKLNYRQHKGLFGI